MFKTSLLLVFLSLGGCVAVWGNSYKVASSNSSAVTIEYDPAAFPTEVMNRAAQKECMKYGKNAVLDRDDNGGLGIKVATFRCEREG